MRRVAAGMAILIAVAGVAGCSSASDKSEQTVSTAVDGAQADAAWLSDYGLEGLDARQIVDKLDAMPIDERDGKLRASVLPTELQLSDDKGHEATLEMPADAFYVSVAPYIKETHQCTAHNLTGCKGELRDEKFDVQVEDRAKGTIVEEGERTSFDNGFIGFWLPRDSDMTLTVTQKSTGKTGSVELKTGNDDPTCVTTLKLS